MIMDDHTGHSPLLNLTIAWANVRKAALCHAKLLQYCSTEDIDIVIITEPWTNRSNRTQSHQRYDLYRPAGDWGSETKEQWEERRPRVLAYSRKGKGLQVDQVRPHKHHTKHGIWLTVNGITVAGFYRPPGAERGGAEEKAYTKWVAPPCSIVGGDFNVRVAAMQPATRETPEGKVLAEWAMNQGLDFLGEPGEATHKDGNVLDLTLANVSATSEVRPDLFCGSDHFTIVTTVSRGGKESSHNGAREELGQLCESRKVRSSGHDICNHLPNDGRSRRLGHALRRGLCWGPRDIWITSQTAGRRRCVVDRGV